MQKKIQSALISVFYKEGLAPLALALRDAGIIIYSTGGTQQYLETAGIACTPVESLTGYPSILGGRVKTLHPVVFGGILGRRQEAQDVADMREFSIPPIDLVIVDLYPFEETVRNTTEEKLIIEKIDIGGPSMIRAAAKNFQDTVVVASKEDYEAMEKIIRSENATTTIEQRRAFAAKAFDIVMQYDTAISRYFHAGTGTLRYGENPHQSARFSGDTACSFVQLHGKELSYNNLVDIDAAIQIAGEFGGDETLFAIIKHTNVCGIALRPSATLAWEAALAGDPESAFGGVLLCNRNIDEATAKKISGIFFEVLMATSFSQEAFDILAAKKNRILLQLQPGIIQPATQVKSVLGGILEQDTDTGNYKEWNEVGGRIADAAEKEDLVFANITCKHLKSNAIALVKNKQLVGKGCGQTSRIDALRQAIEKAGRSGFSLEGAVLASDAFFPFGDCVQLAHEAGITAFIQPGGSVRDNESIDYCKTHQLAMVLTGMRHFRH